MSIVEKFENYFENKKNKYSSLPVETWKNTFEKYSFSQYLPYDTYDELSDLYIHNDGSYGFCCEVSPRVRSGGTTATTIYELLGKLPEDVYLQNFYYGSKNITKKLNEYKNEHMARKNMGGKDAAIVGSTIEEMCEFLNIKTSESITTNMTTKLKTVRIFFSVIGKKRKKTLRFKKDLMNILNSNNFFPTICKPAELHNLLYEILNPNVDVKDFPPYSNSKELNRQMISPNTDFYVNDDYLTISDKATWVNLTPQSFSNNFHISELGMKLGAFIGPSLNSDQFQDSFIISTTICKKPRASATAASRNHGIIIGQKWSEALFRNFANVRKESVSIKDRIDDKNELLYEFDMDILVSGDTPEKAESNAQTIESYWAKSNNEGQSKIYLAKTKGIHHLSFLSNLPMACNDEYFKKTSGKFHSFFADQASHLFPVEADYAGQGTNLPLITRRGNLAFFDLFESNSNFNGFLVATSGAGKSVLLNMLAYNSYARGDRVFVLDYDNSFSGLISSVDGQYLELDPETKTISFNPFSNIKSVAELNEEIEYLSSFIYLIGSSKSTAKADEDLKLIKVELQTIIKEQYQLFKQDLEITNIRDGLRKEFDDDIRFKDFARQLAPYCKNGLYEKWFCGRCELNLEKDFMGIEFKGVEAHEDLRDALIMLLLYHIGKVMFSTDPNKPRIQVIIDEAHRFLGKNPKMDDFIEQAYRRARKYDGSMIIATQGFDDIYDPTGGLSKAGKTIVNNSAWKLFLKQTVPSTNLMIKSGVFGFNFAEEELLRSVTTRKGEYSEIFIISPDEEKAAFRLVMPKFFYYLTTTDSKDKKKIHYYETTFNLNKIDAIKRLINEEEN